MTYRLITLGLVSFSLIFATVAQATDSNGNYTQQDFFPPGNPEKEYALRTWKVVSVNLNCRKEPGITQPITRTFKKNNPLLAVTAHGSHENEGYLQMDAQGKPWMKVGPTQSPKDICFVRANRAYIAPVLKKL